MPHVMRLMQFFLALSLSAPIPALAKSESDGVDPEAMGRYLDLKNDESLIVGEGVARLRDHDDNPVLAQKAASASARASLAQAVQSKISVLTSDTMVVGAEGYQEKVSSRSTSVSEVELVNVRTKALIDFPKKGHVSVIAWITRKDYRELLGGRLDDSPHGGLRLWGGIASFSKLAENQAWKPASGAPAGFTPGGSTGPEVGFDLNWGAWAFETQISWIHPVEWVFHDPKKNALGLYTSSSQQFILGLGYNFSFNRSRLQPYLPLRLEAGGLFSTPWSSYVFGASAGLGLRYWFNNNLALDLRGAQRFGLNSAYQGPDGQVQHAPGVPLEASLSGTRVNLGILFTD